MYDKLEELEELLDNLENGMFSSANSLTEALEYGTSLLEAAGANKACAITAIMVYQNTLIKALKGVLNPCEQTVTKH